MATTVPAGQPSYDEIRTMFRPGQRVEVAHVHKDAWDEIGPDGVKVRRVVAVPQPVFTGTVEAYWRNGCYRVREDRFGTTCCYDYRELTVI